MKRTWMRAGVALTAAGALAIGFAGTASAEDEKDNPVTAVPSVTTGWTVNGAADSSVKQINAGLISLSTPDGSSAAVYCIDIFTKLDVTHQYQEGTWDESNVANLPKVQWVLNNSYPNVDAGKLAEKSEAVTDGLDAKTLDQAAYTATQTAVWSFTDAFKLELTDSTGENEKIDAAVASMYTYLTKNAKEMPEPTSEITLDGPDTFENSEKGGPFSITTPGGSAKIKVEGAKVVDENDKELTEVESGQEFYLLPDDGSKHIKLTATSETSTPSGAVFLTTGEPAGLKELKTGKSQRLILAKPLPGEVGAEWEFDLEGSDTLPVTGMSLTNSLLAGAGLLLLGALAVVLVRRRRVAASWGEA